MIWVNDHLYFGGSPPRSVTWVAQSWGITVGHAVTEISEAGLSLGYSFVPGLGAEGQGYS